MKAIITNGKRTEIYGSALNIDQLKEFVAREFPRMKNTSLSFKDKTNNPIPIQDQDDI